MVIPIRHCSTGSGRGPQLLTDLDTLAQTDKGALVPAMNTQDMHTQTHTHTHAHTHTHRHTHTCAHTYTRMHTHTYTNTNMHTHMHACTVTHLHTSNGVGAHSIVDHIACEVGQQDAGDGQEYPSHCCTVLHQHCHSTGVLTVDY